MAQLLIFIAKISCCATSFVETTKLEARTRHSNVIRCSKVRAISRRSISTVIHGSLFRSMFFIYMFNLFVHFFHKKIKENCHIFDSFFYFLSILNFFTYDKEIRKKLPKISSAFFFTSLRRKLLISLLFLSSLRNSIKRHI